MMFYAAALAVGSTTFARGQLVTPKTVPVRQENQFAIFPSLRGGMADLGIALDDTLADPFSNPAKAVAVRSGTVFALPYAHGISEEQGSGTTLPIGGFATLGSWTGGAVLALQQLDRGVRVTGNNQRTASNRYAVGMLARRLGNGVSVGGSAYVADLKAVDDVDLLYQGNDRLNQSGTLADLRLGVTKQWPSNRRLDAVIVHNRTNVTQDVHYPARTAFWPVQTTTPARSDHNVDKTIIWGGHTQYVQTIGTQGWRVGAIATANHLAHPKIPNYQLQNIPRDPGNTWAFNLGAGVGRLIGRTSLGADAVLEPMVSDTWGTAENDTSGAAGTLIRAGGRTVSNHFRFTNTRVRVGVGHDFATDSSGVWGFQLGLSAYSIRYHLHQTNHVQGGDRWQWEDWTEWTPTFGLRWLYSSFQIHYTYRRTCGPNDCVSFGMGDKVTVTAPTTGGVIAAPSTALSIRGGTAHAHRLLLSVPVR